MSGKPSRLRYKQSKHLRRAIRAIMSDTDKERQEQATITLTRARIIWSWERVNACAQQIGVKPIDYLCAMARCAYRRTHPYCYPQWETLRDWNP